MKKILITGATDGIGKLTALSLIRQGHHLLIHGRSREKVERVSKELHAEVSGSQVDGYVADLSDLGQVERFIRELREKNKQLDVLINNAGVFKTEHAITRDGIDVRFVVNTIAPYMITRGVLSLIEVGGRIINLSSAAQSPVDLSALRGERRLDDMAAYSQSKLAITMWTASLAESLKPRAVAVSVNPGSLLATKMVKEGFGVAGKDLRIGADILCRAALDPEFDNAHGRYFDNDLGQFAALHAQAADEEQREGLIRSLDEIIASLTSKKDPS